MKALAKTPPQHSSAAIFFVPGIGDFQWQEPGALQAENVQHWLRSIQHSVGDGMEGLLPRKHVVRMLGCVDEEEVAMRVAISRFDMYDAMLVSFSVKKS